MTTVAKFTIIAFGLFFIGAGLLMLFNPKKARATLRKAGSTNFINYAELIIRMVPAAALIIYADLSRCPEAFTVAGWFMLVTSVMLCLIPRRLHHDFSNKAADVLKPLYFQFISPFSFIIGGIIIYSVN